MSSWEEYLSLETIDFDSVPNDLLDRYLTLVRALINSRYFYDEKRSRVDDRLLLKLEEVHYDLAASLVGVEVVQDASMERLVSIAKKRAGEEESSV